MRIYPSLFIVISLGLLSCKHFSENQLSHESTFQSSPSSGNDRKDIPQRAVIAHRGASHDAPEGTHAAYILAKDLGVDYLEVDLQITKDGHLIAFHDKTLARTTNIADVFPNRIKDNLETFTLSQLKSLDAGTWFNQKYPDRRRAGFAGLKILTLEEVIDIAEQGNNVPGLYIETKKTKYKGHIEKDLRDLLLRKGWISKKELSNTKGKARVILQTFEKESLKRFKTYLPQQHAALLLWLGEGYVETKETTKKTEQESWSQYYARQEPQSKEAFTSWLDFALENGASIAGPSISRSDLGDQSYGDMMKPWMIKEMKERGLMIHPYTVDSIVDFKKHDALGAVGFFTNRPAVLLEFYDRASSNSVQQILAKHGY